MCQGVDAKPAKSGEKKQGSATGEKDADDGDDSGGQLIAVLLLLIVGGLTAVTVHTAYSAHDVQFSQMPSDVQHWMEMGQYVMLGRTHARTHAIFGQVRVAIAPHVLALKLEHVRHNAALESRLISCF